MFITDREDFDFKPLWKGKVRLQGTLIYQDSVVGLIVVPDGFEFDLASYGKISRSVFDKLGQSMRPAAVHDWLYGTQPVGVTRAQADMIYRDALILEGANAASAYSQWLGVRAGGWVFWNRRSKSKMLV